MELSEDIIEKVKQLQEKYAATGQDLNSYLEGLLYADYVKYWDYIQVDTLLSLQKPRTNFPDEVIFIMYHQVTELYFKLSLHELEQLANKEDLNGEFLAARLTRVNRYFEALTKSFEIMINGMEREQFLKYRMSLLPASGFQSGQYRKIEIACANFLQLVEKDERHKFSADYSEDDIPNMFEWIYWKKGATELESGKKTLTLIQFEEKYKDEFIALAKKLKNKNVWALYKSLPEAEQQKEELILALRQLDINVNVNWPLVHYKSAARYLQKDPMDIAATGGTNWQKYLPPRFQKRIFYPSLWSVKEIEEWGKGWVESVVREL
jgi:tryptophan 2,3-dioxygenase